MSEEPVAPAADAPAAEAPVVDAVDADAPAAEEEPSAANFPVLDVEAAFGPTTTDNGGGEEAAPEAGAADEAVPAESAPAPAPADANATPAAAAAAAAEEGEVGGGAEPAAADGEAPAVEGEESADPAPDAGEAAPAETAPAPAEEDAAPATAAEAAATEPDAADTEAPAVEAEAPEPAPAVDGEGNAEGAPAATEGGETAAAPAPDGAPAAVGGEVDAAAPADDEAAATAEAHESATPVQAEAAAEAAEGGGVDGEAESGDAAATAAAAAADEPKWDGPTIKVVFCRHGESEWNALNQFCGWFDAALSDNGKAEAKAGGAALKEQGYTFDAVHSSVLQRANTTAAIILEELGATESVPIAKTWRLNERHYGGLTGLNKAETAEKYGEDQVKIWRRSFDVPPLAMEADHAYYKTIQEDERYADVPKEELPNCEALKNCIERSLPYWQETIEPQLREGKKLLVAAHGNSLRGIVKHLDSLTAEEIMGIDLPTGIPFEYELTLPDLKPVSSMKFIGDDETVAKAIAKVKKQGAAKKTAEPAPATPATPATPAPAPTDAPSADPSEPAAGGDAGGDAAPLDGDAAPTPAAAAEEVETAPPPAEKVASAPAEELQHAYPPGSPVRPARVTRSNPLDLNWAFGYTSAMPGCMHLFTDAARDDIFMISGNTGVLLDRANNEQTLLQGHRNVITAVAATDDKRWIATADAGKDASLIVWDSRSGVPTRAFFSESLPENISAMTFSVDGKYIAVVGISDKGNTVAIFEWAEASVEGSVASVFCPKDPCKTFTDVTFSKVSNSRVICTGIEQVVIIDWSADGKGSWMLPLTILGPPPTVGGFVQSIGLPDSEEFLSTTTNGYAVLWRPDDDKTTGFMECYKFIKLSKTGISFAMYTPDNSTFVAGCTDGTLRYYDLTFRLIGWNDQVGSSAITAISFVSEDEGSSIKSLSATGEERLKLGLAHESLHLPDYCVCTSMAEIYAVRTEQAEEVSEFVMMGQNSEVHSIAAHPKDGTLAVAGYAGLLQLYQYQSRSVVASIQLREGLFPETMSFSPDGDSLVVGYTDGTVELLDVVSLRLLAESTTFREGDAAVKKVVWSSDGQHFATMDDDRCVGLYRLQPDDFAKPWLFVGKNQAHFRAISDIIFIESKDGEQRLLSLGEDRMLQEYDLVGSGFFEGLVIKGKPVKTEQTAVPKALVKYPNLQKEDLLLISNSDFKFKLLNSTTKATRKTLLGPTFDGESIDSMLVLPAFPHADSDRVLAFISGDKVGLALLGLDGNPARSMVLVGGGGKIQSLQCSFDGRYVFVGVSNSVLMFVVNADVLKASSTLAGEGVEPFVRMLDGGREGDLFIEMEEFFYYAQLQHQGLSSSGERKISDELPLSEVPRVLRALGHYPSERDIADMENEVKLSTFMEDGLMQSTVTLPTLVKLYINHRSVVGLTPSLLDGAVKTLGDDNGVSATDFASALVHLGEVMSEKELAAVMASLEFSLEDLDHITTQVVSEDMLGFN